MKSHVPDAVRRDIAKAPAGGIDWELRMVAQRGLRILERLELINGDVFQRRPQLQWRDWMIIVWRATTS